jgi:hypothetical protein
MYTCFFFLTKARYFNCELARNKKMCTFLSLCAFVCVSFFSEVIVKKQSPQLSVHHMFKREAIDSVFD